LMTDEIGEYIEALIASGRKVSTMKTYECSLRKCVEILEAGGHHHRAADITEEDILFLKDRLPLKEATVRQYLMLLNGMLIHHTGRDVVRPMKLLWNRTIRDRRFITKAEFARMYRVADDRERMILVLGAFMGLRRGEIASICISDIRGDRMLIHGKGHGREGLVVEQHVPAEVLMEVQRYLAWRESLGCVDMSGGRLIVYKVRGQDELRGYPERSSAISDMISSVCARARVCATTHSLRRLYATTLYYDQGVDLCTLRDLMRHSNINTTLSCYIEGYDSRRVTALDTMSRCFGELIYTESAICEMQFTGTERIS